MKNSDHRRSLTKRTPGRMNATAPVSKTLWALVIALLLTATPAPGGDQGVGPCPWKGTEQQSACAQWDALAERLQAAERRAAQAEARLNTVLELVREAGHRAAQIETPEADQARRIIDRLLDNLASSLSGAGRLEIDQDYPLTQDGDGYLATFPVAAWVTDTTRLEIAPLRLRTQALEDESFKVDIVLGDTVQMRQKDQTVAQLALDQQAVQVIWDDALGHVTRLDVGLKGLKLTFPGQPLEATLESFELDQTMGAREHDGWASEQQLELSNLKLRLAEMSWQLGHFSGTLDLDGKRYRELLGLVARLGKVMRSDQQSDATAAQLLGLAAELLQLMSRLSASLSASELVIDTPAGRRLATVTRGRLQAQLTDDADQGSTLGLILSLDGMRLFSKSVPRNVTPTTARLHLVLDNLPPQLGHRLAQLARRGEDGSGIESQPPLATEHILETLRGSRLGVKIKDSFVEASGARVDLDFASSFDPESALGSTGALELQVEGLDRLIDASSTVNLPGSGPVLALMTLFSDRIRHDGRNVDRFGIRVTRDGRLWLNDKDVTALVLPDLGWKN